MSIVLFSILYLLRLTNIYYKGARYGEYHIWRMIREMSLKFSAKLSNRTKKQEDERLRLTRLKDAAYRYFANWEEVCTTVKGLTDAENGSPTQIGNLSLNG